VHDLAGVDEHLPDPDVGGRPVGSAQVTGVVPRRPLTSPRPHPARLPEVSEIAL
jgi:hypothetical protein